MKVVSLSEKKMKYTALSYEWGPEGGDYTISVNNTPFSIRKNLYDFLHTWTGVKDSDTPWFIDYICIDQSNDEEKASQVQLFGSLYSNATNVVAWLGPMPSYGIFDPPLDGYLYNWYKSMYAPDRVANLCLKVIPGGSASSNEDKEGVLLAYLAARLSTFWTRLWIVQEIILARKLTLVMGKKEVNPQYIHDWSTLKDSRLQITETVQLSGMSPLMRPASILDRHWELAANPKLKRPYLYESMILFASQKW